MSRATWLGWNMLERENAAVSIAARYGTDEYDTLSTVDKGEWSGMVRRKDESTEEQRLLWVWEREEVDNGTVLL